MTIPKSITKDHILRVIQEIDDGKITLDPLKASDKYDLVINDRRYPPKEVISLAYRYVNDGGKELPVSSFSGGKEANTFLERLGFSVIIKADVSLDDVAIKDEFDELYTNLLKFIKQAQVGGLKYRSYLKQYCDLKVKVSFGQGNASYVSWMAFLKPGQEVANGYYPAFYYDKEDSKLFLVLGVSKKNKPLNNWPDDFSANYKKFKDLSDVSYAINDKYPNSFLVDRYNIEVSDIDKSLGQNKDRIYDNLSKIIDVYINDVHIGIEESDIKLENTILLAKKQVILYGPPGTGKTYITKELVVNLLRDV